MADIPEEQRPLLGKIKDNTDKHAKLLAAVLVTLALLIATPLFVVHELNVRNNPARAVGRILGNHPVIDSHIDLPEFVRFAYRNNASAVDLTKRVEGHVDIPRLKEGRVGGFFWSVYVGCPKSKDPNFITPTNSVRDTLEQIDVAKALIAKYPNTFHFSTSVRDIRYAFSQGKIASLLGVEGGHQLGNSLAVLRQYAALGVRYVTLTHGCHNAFADSAGIYYPSPLPLHHGLSPLGRTLIKELNRLGVLVDVSHTSDDTTRQVVEASEAPIIWSHSSARGVWDVPRNVPDDILKLIGTGKGKRDAVVQVNFLPGFVAAPGKATVQVVADHVEHIGRVAGRKHVGLGSDYDGMSSAPKDLEDASTYPNLFIELHKRGWTTVELAGLAGENLLRVFQGAEDVAKKLRKEGRAVEWGIYEKRTDL